MPNPLLDALYYAVMCALQNQQTYHATRLWDHAEQLRLQTNASTDNIPNYNLARTRYQQIIGR